MILQEFFQKNPGGALAFSGGVDSAYLLYAAGVWGKDWRAYYVKSPFQPDFEWQDALRLAKEQGVPMTTLPVDVLQDPLVAENSPERCYHCKKAIFQRIIEEAKKDGCTLLIDGTNASDDAGDRPGMRALRELSVRSPLRECGLTKDAIRRLSKEAGLFTWDKPAYACLATRIPTGTSITKEMLRRTEEGEDFLFSLGFSDFRVRMTPEGGAKLQLPASQLPKLLQERQKVLCKLKECYPSVVLDLEVRHE